MGIRDWLEVNLQRLEHALLNYSAPLMFLFIFALIIIDIINSQTELITTPIVGLILVLLILPYVQYIQRLKWGPFEAELDRQIEEVENSVRSLSDEKDPETTERQELIRDQLYNFLEDDPKVAVAALWIEIEETLRSELYRDDEKKPQAYSVLLSDAQERDVIGPDMYSNINQIRSLRNEALHGGEITRGDAKRIIEIGIQVLSHLYENSDLSGDVGLSVSSS